MKEQEILVVLCTCPNTATAEQIARELVGAALAACVNVLPGIRSIYRWNDVVESGEEVMLILKVPRDRLGPARERLVELHPYDVPEFVAVSVADGHHPYLQWVVDSTRTPGT